MSQHNKYVFDFENKKLIGDFEAMYLAEHREEFDSWQQDEMSLYKKIDLAMLSEYNFSTIVDLGCGKGAFTNLLKKQNNQVIGIDVSQTAIRQAQIRYPNIDFRVLNLENTENIRELYLGMNFAMGGNLTLARATLYYLKNWKEVIDIISQKCNFFCAGLNIPKETLGTIPNQNVFITEIEKHFQIIHHIDYPKKHSFTLFCKSKKC